MNALDYYIELDKYTLREFLLDEFNFVGKTFEDMESFENYLIRLLDTDREYIEDCLDDKVAMGSVHCDIIRRLCAVTERQIKYFYEKAQNRDYITDDELMAMGLRKKAKYEKVYRDYYLNGISKDKVIRKYKLGTNADGKIKTSKVIHDFYRDNPDFKFTISGIEELIRQEYKGMDIICLCGVGYNTIAQIRSRLYSEEPWIAKRNKRKNKWNNTNQINGFKRSLELRKRFLRDMKTHSMEELWVKYYTFFRAKKRVNEKIESSKKFVELADKYPWYNGSDEKAIELIMEGVSREDILILLLNNEKRYDKICEQMLTNS